MRLTVVYPDSRVVKDGESYTVNLPQADIHAIQWHDDHGEIETADGNETFTDSAVIQPYLDLWQAAYVAAHPAPTLSSRKADKLAAIAAKTDDVFAGGYFPPSGTLQGESLQCRNEIDRTNWLTSLMEYSAQIGAGQGATVGATFRTTANHTLELTYSEGLAVLFAMAGWGKAIYANAWALKDAVMAAANQAALDAIDITTGWPS